MWLSFHSCVDPTMLGSVCVPHTGSDISERPLQVYVATWPPELSDPEPLSPHLAFQPRQK